MYQHLSAHLVNQFDVSSFTPQTHLYKILRSVSSASIPRKLIGKREVAWNFCFWSLCWSRPYLVLSDDLVRRLGVGERYVIRLTSSSVQLWSSGLMWPYSIGGWLVSQTSIKKTPVGIHYCCLGLWAALFLSLSIYCIKERTAMLQEETIAMRCRRLHILATNWWCCYCWIMERTQDSRRYTDYLCTTGTTYSKHLVQFHLNSTSYYRLDICTVLVRDICTDSTNAKGASGYMYGSGRDRNLAFRFCSEPAVPLQYLLHMSSQPERGFQGQNTRFSISAIPWKREQSRF